MKDSNKSRQKSRVGFDVEHFYLGGWFFNILVTSERLLTLLKYLEGEFNNILQVVMKEMST